jgi:hypothetical protein
MLAFVLSKKLSRLSLASHHSVILFRVELSTARVGSAVYPKNKLEGRMQYRQTHFLPDRATLIFPTNVAEIVQILSQNVFNT